MVEIRTYEGPKLDELKERLTVDCFGPDYQDALSAGLCINCKELAEPKCYSPEGVKEYAISGLCEPCFDEITGGSG